ncbi:MAG TPA: hypothetical protein VII23_20895 [Terriglobales bacterium]|jgi:hypothetical protein
MSSGGPFRSASRYNTPLLILALLALPLLTAEFVAAQIHGIPPSVTSIQNHFPPYLPNIAPSVTSVGPRGYVGPPAFPVYPASGRHIGHSFGNRYGSRNGYGYYGGGFVAPYYTPAFDTSYGYETGGGGGPYMYSGPPTEQTLHIVVDLPTAKHDDESLPPPAKSKSDSVVIDARDAKPIDPTVLVFRDGHQQEVTNYAIMGQTVYVFDSRTQKIALTDLDVAATIKLNDDHGVDFHVPAHNKS